MNDRDFTDALYLSKLKKKCWVKYNPALGKMVNLGIVLFWPSGWVTVQKVGLNI